MPREKIALVFGPNGVGKSTLLKQIGLSLRDSQYPVVVFQMGSGSPVGSFEGFLEQIISGVESDWPELEPYVAAFSNYRCAGELDSTRQAEEFVAKLDEYFFQSEQRDTHPELADLQVLFIIEDLDGFEAAELEAFRVMNQALAADPLYANHYHFLFSGASKVNCIECIQSIFLGRADIDEVLVPPFSQPETDSFLTHFGVEPSKFAEIHRETGGLPSQLHAFCREYEPEDASESEKLELAATILKSLGREQEEWLKIAALLPSCDEEGLGLFLSEDQRGRAFKWLRIGYLECIEIVGSQTRVRDVEREALIAHQKRENLSKLTKRLRKVQHLESVRRVIPKLEHRHLLSLLAEFDYFDREVLVFVFGDGMAETFLHLVESKTAFFSILGVNTRLSHNTRIMMRMYNQLFPVKDLATIRAKVKAYWAKRTEQLKHEIAESEERISGNEAIREDVKTGISQLDTQIGQLAQQLNVMDKERKTMIVSLRRNGVGYLSIILQVMGIVALYVAVLYREDYMMEILVIAGSLITVGFLVSLRRHGNIKVSHTKVLKHSQKRNQTAKELEHLKTEKLQLATRRDQSMKSVQENRDKIQLSETLLKQPYMRM